MHIRVWAKWRKGSQSKSRIALAMAMAMVRSNKSQWYECSNAQTLDCCHTIHDVRGEHGNIIENIDIVRSSVTNQLHTVWCVWYATILLWKWHVFTSAICYLAYLSMCVWSANSIKCVCNAMCTMALIHEAKILNNGHTIHGMLQFVGLRMDYLTLNYRTCCACTVWNIRERKQ